MPAHQAPYQAEGEQGQDGVAEPEVPDHRVAADLGAYHGADDAGGQEPVEEPCGQVPHTDTAKGGRHGGAGSRWRVKDTRLPAAWRVMPARALEYVRGSLRT